MVGLTRTTRIVLAGRVPQYSIYTVILKKNSCCINTTSSMLPGGTCLQSSLVSNVRGRAKFDGKFQSRDKSSGLLGTTTAEGVLGSIQSKNSMTTQVQCA
jgi:hypothetical protein